MNTIRNDFSFNLNVELNLSDSQFAELFNVYGPDFNSELYERLHYYIQSSIVDMLQDTRVDTEFMIAMQLEPNGRNTSHATIGANYLYR